MNTKVTTSKDLLKDLTNVYEGVRNGELSLNQAKEAANVAGKITGLVKVQLDYNKWVKNGKEIDFLEC